MERMPEVLGISNNTLSVTSMDQAGAVSAALPSIIIRRDYMDLAEYQKLAGTVDTGPGGNGLKPEWIYYVLGIAGETGELVEKIKKLFRDDKGFIHQERLDAIMAEMGDCLWYHSRLASMLGFTLNEVAERSIKKYVSRQLRGKVHGDGDNR